MCNTGTGDVYSCFGEYINFWPDQRNITPPYRLKLFAVKHTKNVRKIEAFQFSGLRTKELRLEHMETLRLEHWAFSGIRDLRTLRLSHNNFGTMGKPSLIFAGLTNLTVLDLSYNQITGWMSEG